MRIRWLVTIGGTVEGRIEGVAPGLEMDVPDVNGARYIANRYAEQVHGAAPPPEERAVVTEIPETAVPPADVAEKAVAPPVDVTRRPRTRK